MQTQTTTGSRIEQARNQLGLSLAQLASRISVESKTLANWEKNRIEPRGEELMKLAGVLQVPMVWLLTGETPKGSFRNPETRGCDEPAQKLERALAKQQTLTDLLNEVSVEIAELRRESKEKRDLVA